MLKTGKKEPKKSTKSLSTILFIVCPTFSKIWWILRSSSKSPISEAKTTTKPAKKTKSKDLSV